MGFFGDVLGGAGAIAGGVAGLPGMIGGAWLGNKAGGAIQNKFGSQPFSQDNSGQPGYPTFVGMDTNQFRNNPQLDKFAGESMRNGPSEGTKFALQQNTLATNNAVDQARKMGQGIGKQAEAGLAMKGGLGAGAAERIQKQAGNAALDFSSQAQGIGMGNRANMLISDEAARNQNLGSAANMVGQNNANLYGRLAQANQMQNQYNLGKYGIDAGMWGANKQADASAYAAKNSGGLFGNGGFLGTGIF